MRRRRPAVLILVAAAGLGAPAGASAATASLDLPCYVSGQPGTVALTGFSPNAAVSVASDDLGATTVRTDATGASVIALTPPSGNDITPPGSRPFAVTATEVANPAKRARAVSRIAPLAFSTRPGTMSPKSKRSWHFSGWTAGQPVYAHFRLRGVTRGSYRFGVATGPCGELRRRAPAIAVKGAVRTGAWMVQVDQAAHYSASTLPSLRATTPVFKRFRRQPATGAAALSAAALSGLYRFGGFWAGV